MGSLARQHHLPIAPPPRLLSIAQQPEVKRANRKAGRARVCSILEYQGAVVLHCIRGRNLLEMRSGSNQLAQKKVSANKRWDKLKTERLSLLFSGYCCPFAV